MQRFHPAVVALHWLMALLILCVHAACGLSLANMPPDSADKVQGLAGHMAIGTTIGVLLLIRLAIRLTTAHPPLFAARIAGFKAAADPYAGQAYGQPSFP